MAGIGFQLKKLFGRRGIVASLSGVFYSMFITVGNILFIMIAMFAINFILNDGTGSTEVATTIFTILLYCFAFSFMFVSGTSMLMSRFVADKIYRKEFNKILPSMYGGLAIILPVMSVVGIVFLSFSTFPFAIKLLTFVLYLQAGTVTFISTYMSAVKAFKQISFTFLIGMTVTVLLAYFLPKDNAVQMILFAIVVGFTIILSGLLLVIKNYFEPNKENVFDFLNYFPQFYKLFLINTLISLTNYIHNILFWQIDDLQYRVGGNFICAPDYDAAVFVAILSTISVTVIFVVKTETTFYDSYKEYLLNIKSGTHTQIEKSRNKMSMVLRSEITFVMEVQFIISAFFLVFSINVLPSFGFSNLTIELLPFAIGGYFFSAIFMCIVTLLLYFENYNKALTCAIIHFFLTTLLTLLSIWLGDRYYGISLAISGALSLVLSLKYISQTLSRANYKVYCNYEMFDQNH